MQAIQQENMLRVPLALSSERIGHSVVIENSSKDFGKAIRSLNIMHRAGLLEPLNSVNRCSKL